MYFNVLVIYVIIKFTLRVSSFHQSFEFITRFSHKKARCSYEINVFAVFTGSFDILKHQWSKGSGVFAKILFHSHLLDKG